MRILMLISIMVALSGCEAQSTPTVDEKLYIEIKEAYKINTSRNSIYRVEFKDGTNCVILNHDTGVKLDCVRR